MWFLWICNNVLAEYDVSIFKAEDGGSMFHQNVTTYLPDYTTPFQDCNPELYVHYTVKLTGTNISALNYS
jgi:hypothetical protein